MEARLAARAAEVATTPILRIPVAPEPPPAAPAPVVAPGGVKESSSDAAEGEEAVPVVEVGEPAAWPDEAAESSFRAEARARGEVPVPPLPAAEVEETDPKGLPPLETLVRRIPVPVIEALDDLFRARFVRVQKVPRRALKSGG